MDDLKSVPGPATEGTKCGTRIPRARRRRQTTPECYLTSYNTVGGHSIGIFWHTGVDRGIKNCMGFHPPGHPWTAPLGHTTWDVLARPSPSPGQMARGAT